MDVNKYVEFAENIEAFTYIKTGFEILCMSQTRFLKPGSYQEEAHSCPGYGVEEISRKIYPHSFHSSHSFFILDISVARKIGANITQTTIIIMVCMLITLVRIWRGSARL